MFLRTSRVGVSAQPREELSLGKDSVSPRENMLILQMCNSDPSDGGRQIPIDGAGLSLKESDN